MYHSVDRTVKINMSIYKIVLCYLPSQGWFCGILYGHCMVTILPHRLTMNKSQPISVKMLSEEMISAITTLSQKKRCSSRSVSQVLIYFQKAHTHTSTSSNHAYTKSGRAYIHFFKSLCCLFMYAPFCILIQV